MVDMVMVECETSLSRVRNPSPLPALVWSADLSSESSLCLVPLPMSLAVAASEPVGIPASLLQSTIACQAEAHDWRLVRVSS